MRCITTKYLIVAKASSPIRLLILLLSCTALLVGCLDRATVHAADDRGGTLPEENERWVRPNGNENAPPLWGHANGLQIGLAPFPGPRGLLRVYAPYLGHPMGRVINFIAVEPIPQGETGRGLSELEFSQLDQTQGKRFWSANDPNHHAPPSQAPAARGWLENVDGVECLRVLILVERFDNGAHVYLRLTFRADRPHEVGIATFAHDDSKPLEHCIVTATMGNYARLRKLQLADRSVLAGDLWPDYRESHFTAHEKFSLDKLKRTEEGHAIATALPNEEDPRSAVYAPGTRSHWKYQGEIASQSWRSENVHPDLEVWVNGRWTYWMSQAPIPHGVSFENFEMVTPFQQGAELWFSVEPLPSDTTP